MLVLYCSRVTGALKKSSNSLSVNRGLPSGRITVSSRERSGSVVECLTRDRRAAGSSLTGVTALCP